ncbi:phage protease [Candidatus Electronema sp. JM]|uniref:phage protease n=1 Tax=Candidatus Electronema sp. JM TaxID=3401571 RepID=UPI003AA8FC6E
MTLYVGKAQPVNLGADNALPDWVTWFPEGKAQLEDGPEYWVTPESWQLVKAAIDRRGLELVVDYEHQTLNSEKNGQPAPAMGWCKEWRYVPGVGIQARVEWKQAGADFLRKGEYRYFSPVFDIKKGSDGKLILSRVYNLALTNDPRTNNLKAIAAKLAAGENGMDVQQIAALLGMAETATPEEVLAELGKLKEKTGKLAELLGLPAEAGYDQVLAAVQQLVGPGAEEMAAMKKEQVCAAKMKAALGLPKDASDDLAVMTIKAKAGAGDQAKGMAEKLAALEEEAASVKAEKLLAKYAAKLSPGMLADKEADWAGFAKRDPKGFEQIAKSLPDAVPAPLPSKQEQADNVHLTQEDEVYCAKFGVDKKEYLKTKQEVFHG